MVQRTGGFRAKTRNKMSKPARARGKISTTRYLQEFQLGDRVTILQEPAFHKNTPSPKFKAKTGIIIGQQGRAYKVRFYDGNKEKIALSAPIHLVKAK